jgi:hypothetical protein
VADAQRALLETADGGAGSACYLNYVKIFDKLRLLAAELARKSSLKQVLAAQSALIYDFYLFIIFV